MFWGFLSFNYFIYSLKFIGFKGIECEINRDLIISSDSNPLKIHPLNFCLILHLSFCNVTLKIYYHHERAYIELNKVIKHSRNLEEVFKVWVWELEVEHSLLLLQVRVYFLIFLSSGHQLSLKALNSFIFIPNLNICVLWAIGQRGLFILIP